MRNIKITLSFILLFSKIQFINAQNYGEAFEYVFEEKDFDSLYVLLMDWNEKIKSNQDSIRNNSNDTIIAIYEVFNEFYSPYDLIRIGGSELDDITNTNHLAIIQNNIKYIIKDIPNPDTLTFIFQKDTLALGELVKKYGKKSREYRMYSHYFIPDVYISKGDLKQIEIKDFRPQTKIPASKKLYLTNAHQNELCCFLGNQRKELGNEECTKTIIATKKSFERLNFLNKFLSIVYRPVGGYWQMETYPIVSLVILNPNLDRALLSFRLAHKGGHAYLEYENSRWILRALELNWVE